MAEDKSKYIKELFPTIPNSNPITPRILGYKFWAYVKKYIHTESGRLPASVATIHKDIFGEKGNSLIKCHDDVSFDKKLKEISNENSQEVKEIIQTHIEMFISLFKCLRNVIVIDPPASNPAIIPAVPKTPTSTPKTPTLTPKSTPKSIPKPTPKNLGICLKANCGRHNAEQIGILFNVPPSTIIRKIESENIVFPIQNYLKSCKMCDMILNQPLFAPNLPFKRLNDEIFSIVKNQCGHHSQNMMAKMMHVPRTTLIANLREQKENIENDLPASMRLPCEFCRIISEWNGPILQDISTPTSKSDSNFISPTTTITPTTTFTSPKTPFRHFLKRRKTKESSDINPNSGILNTPSTSRKKNRPIAKTLFDHTTPELNEELENKIQAALYDETFHFLEKNNVHNIRNGENAKVMYNIFSREGLQYLWQHKCYPTVIEPITKTHKSFFDKLLIEILNYFDGMKISEKLQSKINDALFEKANRFMNNHFGENDFESRAALFYIFSYEGLCYIKENEKFPCEFSKYVEEESIYFNDLLHEILQFFEDDTTIKPFSKCAERQKRKIIKPIYDLLEKITLNNSMETEDALFFILHNYYYSTEKGNNRKLANIIDTLSKSRENFIKEYRPMVPNDEITFLKEELKLSENQYNVLRDTLKPYLKMSSVNTLRDYTDSLIPPRQDFIVDDVKIGAMYDVKKVIEASVLDCLQLWNDDPKKVPPILHLKAAVGGDVSDFNY